MSQHAAICSGCSGLALPARQNESSGIVLEVWPAAALVLRGQAKGKTKIVLMKYNAASGWTRDGIPTGGNQSFNRLEFLEPSVGHGGFVEAEEAKRGRLGALLNAAENLGVIAHVLRPG